MNTHRDRGDAWIACKALFQAAEEQLWPDQVGANTQRINICVGAVYAKTVGAEGDKSGDAVRRDGLRNALKTMGV